MTSQASNPSNAYTELLMEFGRFREENQKQHGELATRDLRGEVTTTISDLRGEVTTAMTGLRGEFTTETADIRTEIAKAETRTVRWLLGGLASIAVVTVGSIAAAVSVLLFALGD